MGPLIAGVLSTFSLFITMVVLCGSSLVGALIVMLNTGIRFEPVQKTTDIFCRTKDSFKYLRKNKILWRMTLIAMSVNAAEAMVNFSWILTGKMTLNLDDYMIGLIISCYGGGGVLGGLVVQKWLKGTYQVQKLKWPIVLCLLLCSVSAVLPAITLTLYTLFASAILFGMFSTVFAINIWTLRQLLTPKNILGPVSGATSALFKLGMPAAIVLTPIMRDVWPVGVFVVPALYLFALVGYVCLVKFSDIDIKRSEDALDTPNS